MTDTPKPYSTDIVTDPGVWQITEDQIHEIKKGNPLAMNKFYLDNYGKLYAIASGIATRAGRKYGTVFGDTDGIMSQFYLDLPLYNYSSVESLTTCLTNTAFGAQFGGYKTFYRGERFSVSIDAPSTDDELLLIDILTDGKTPYDELYNSDLLAENDKIVLSFIEQNFLDPEERNLIFCYCFTDLKRNQIEGNEYETFKRYSQFYCLA